MSDSLAVANEIIKQIGGKALFMIGAKNIGGGVDYVTFKVGRGARCDAGAVSHIRIDYNAGADTYDFKAIYCRGTQEPKTRMTIEGGFVDMVHAFIQDATGFATSL